MDQPPSVPPPVPVGPPPVPPARPSVAAWRWWVHLLVIGSYPIAMHYFAPFLGWLLGSTPPSDPPPTTAPALGDDAAGLLKTSALLMAMFAVIFAIGWTASKATVEDLRLRWRGGWWPWPLSIGYSIAVRLLAGLGMGAVLAGLWAIGHIKPDEFSKFLTENMPDVSGTVSVASLDQNLTYYVLCLTLVSFIVAGFREELWRSATFAAMEKLFPRSTQGWIGKAAMILVTAVIFGIGHRSQGWMGIVLTGVLGLGFGAIILIHRSIWTAVLAHGFFDAASFALMPYAQKLIDTAQKMQGQ